LKRLIEQSFYEILEIPRGASHDEVERAYERAFAMYGPGSLVTYTLLAPEDAQFLTRRIQEARTVLLDPQARAAYDAGLPPEGGEIPRGSSPVVAAVKAPVPAGPASSAWPEPAAVQFARRESMPSEPAMPGPAALAPPPSFTLPAFTPPPTAPWAPQPGSPFVPPDGSPWTGEILRQARESRGLSVLQVSDRTKITRHHLENIEAERFDKLPAAVYLRGILMALARELGLDGQKVSRSYLERVEVAQKPAGKGR